MRVSSIKDKNSTYILKTKAEKHKKCYASAHPYNKLLKLSTAPQKKAKSWNQQEKNESLHKVCKWNQWFDE